VLNSSLSASTIDHTDVEKLIDSFYNNGNIIYDFNSVGQSNLHKIDILRLKRANSQINLLRALPNYLYMDNIVNVLKTIQ
jgi:hypothetical protein